MQTSDVRQNTDTFSVNQLYDSHVHWLSTGDLALGLNLNGLVSEAQLRATFIKKEYFRGEWLYGFGWDENKFEKDFELNRQTLDRVFPNFPVIFSRADGHSSCLNTLALQRLKMLDSSFLGEIDSSMNGILRETEHMVGILNLPPLTHSEIMSRLLIAQEIFLSQGFTHIRDMASDLKLWNAALELEKQGKLRLHVEFNFTCENRIDFERALLEFKQVQKAKTLHLKPRGIKLYFDGSLGSGTALIGRGPGYPAEGLQLWSNEDIIYVLNKTWEIGAEISIHALGDEAVDRVVRLCRQVSATGLSGVLNLEHVQVLRNETIQLMKPLHIRCHLQPCHWLSDRAWLASRLKGKLAEAFPWERLRLAQVPFSFGSDSPIEVASLYQNLEAIALSSQDGIPALSVEPLKFHQYPFPDGCLTTSEFSGGKLVQIHWDR
jgi:predicted amidohydrolase YtcJ